MSFTPPPIEHTWTSTKFGYGGELGRGANAILRFIQTGLTANELDHIDLIQNIPGSEQWDVRDLFQRSVDHERVLKSIIPYLQDETKVKYFNPLTLVILPFDENGALVPDTTFSSPSTETLDGLKYTSYRRADFYRFSFQEHQAYSRVDWNENAVRIVAIDGQHRLSALKSWHNDARPVAQRMAGWTIPVIILGIFRAEENGAAPTVLEIVRNAFVYINTQAKEVNESRRILLDDESINCLCSQEVVQYSHENDQLPIARLELNRVPLIFYDWRGELKDGRPDPGPAAVKSVQELRDWFQHYLLGDDLDDAQLVRLGLKDIVPPLELESTGRQTLTHADSKRVREQFRNELLPALNKILEDFKPYKEYIRRCREIQRRTERQSHIGRHAFEKVCFGAHRAAPEHREAVENLYLEIVRDFIALKTQTFDGLLQRDIGMRGVLCAFSYLKPLRDDVSGETLSWLTHARWFVKLINGVFDDGWFKSFDDLPKQHQQYLTHIAYDVSGQIINYKHKDVQDAFGPFLGLLVVRRDGDENLIQSAWDSFSNRLLKPLRNGFRKKVRGELRDTFQGTVAEINAKVNFLAEAQQKKRLAKYRKYLDTSPQ